MGSVVLFSGIVLLSMSKKTKNSSDALLKEKEASISISKKNEKSKAILPVGESIVPLSQLKENKLQSLPMKEESDVPKIDRIFQLFTTGSSKLPIVETITYSSSVPWLKGRPAWVADYAVYFGTSKHFIARSLNNAPDYFSQKVSVGSRFNVFKKDKKIEFHLLVDVKRLKMAFYYVDLDTHERVLLKIYPVGLGRIDLKKPSGTLTPLGSYQLGEKVSIYGPGVTGLFHDQKTEMVRVFGSRWIPFGQEIEGCSEPAKGFGIHGAPWIVESKSGDLVENRDCIEKYESDGCIRLLLEDIEEIYAITVTKPTFVHIGLNFHDITLPGVEVGTPSR